MIRDFVTRLAAADIGETYNQYADSALLRHRLASYLAARRDAQVVLVGEAAGYRGARVSGIPFTSERQLTGAGPAEATATIVHRVLAALGVEDEVLLWNVVPTHPGGEISNRRPTRFCRRRSGVPGCIGIFGNHFACCRRSGPSACKAIRGRTAIRS